VKRGAGGLSSNSESGLTSNSEAVYYAHKEDIKQLGTDIRYIDTKPLTIHNSYPKGTIISQFTIHNYDLIWAWYVLPLVLAVIILIVLRKQIKEAADLTRVRYKRANKVAQKRLKAALIALKANDKNAFYAEIERAAWSYLSDRLSIPTADLNKENIAALLQQKGVSEALIGEVKNVLSTAEFARYAPSTDHAMEDLYTATTNLINHLEEEKL